MRRAVLALVLAGALAAPAQARPLRTGDARSAIMAQEAHWFAGAGPVSFRILGCHRHSRSAVNCKVWAVFAHGFFSDDGEPLGCRSWDSARVRGGGVRVVGLVGMVCGYGRGSGHGLP